MAEPQFDPSNGRWYIRYRTPEGGRVKKLLPKHPGWKKLARRPKSTPAEVLAYARPYQDIDARVKLGLPVQLPTPIPLPLFLDDHAKSFTLAGHRPSSVKELRNALRQFRAFCEARKVVQVKAVTPAVCRAFLESCAEKGLARSTIKKFKGLIGPAFVQAFRDGLVDRNPFERLEAPGRCRTEESPFWADAEVAAIEAELRGRARDLFVIGIQCGFRIAALLNLRWGDVKWTDPRHPGGSLVCRAEHSKSGRSYRVPLFPRLRETLERMKAEAGNPGPDTLIFPGRSGQVLRRKTPDRWIEAAMKKAGIPDRGRRCHAMRETFGTRCGARGVNPRTLMAWMGHASLKQTQKYVHFDKASEASEMDKMG
jgi:integrase